jgi:uncharacterized FlgJ-related protein
MKLKFVIFFFAMFPVNLFADIKAVDNTAKVIRNKLFKYDLLLNSSHTNFHHIIIKKFCFSKSDKLPAIALCSMEYACPSSKFNREIFLKSIACTVNCVNEIILEHRRLLRTVIKNGIANLSEKEKSYFRMICSFYQSKEVNELLKRVAPVPLSMAVAQAALESGFCGSKYIFHRNAFFGMMESMTKLLEFDTVFESAIAYAKTLNVNTCYRKFREERMAMMKNSQKIDGVKLSNYLNRYSTEKKYVRRVLALIREYSLSDLDQIYKS